MNNQILKHMEILGFKATDKVTGFKGVITSLCFDLYGCVQAAVTPEATGSTLEGGLWFDVTRLDIKSNKPVMDIPDFAKGYISEGKKGCSFKPAQ